MPSYTLTGLNLRSHALGENDRIMVVLTRERGIVRLVARGARKAKNRWGGRLEPLIRADLEVSTGRGSLDILTGSVPYGRSALLLADLDRLLIGMRLAEAATAIVAEGEANAEAFDALDQALELLAEGARPEPVALWCELRLLDVGGYRPELEDCVVCGAPVMDGPTGLIAFSAQGGGVRCAACPLPSRMVEPVAVALLNALRDLDPAALRNATDPGAGEREAGQVLADAIRTSADVKLKAGDLWERLAT